jgi:hypothetical protein
LAGLKVKYFRALRGATYVERFVNRFSLQNRKAKLKAFP